jgi:hypothetical protein
MHLVRNTNGHNFPGCCLGFFKASPETQDGMLPPHFRLLFSPPGPDGLHWHFLVGRMCRGNRLSCVAINERRLD